MRYWDTSALLPLLIQEPMTPAMRDHLADDSAVVTWWGTRIEAVSALARLERDGDIEADMLRRTLHGLEANARHWLEVPAIEDVRLQATRLLRVHRLRAADALQLAAAIIASDFAPGTLPFVTLDERLAVAADREGFRVLGASLC